MLVYMVNTPVSMHKSFDGLSALVQSQLKLSPLQAHLFVFFNRTRDKVKLLYWDRNGFFIWYKRLEQGRFPALKVSGSHYKLTVAELNLLLEGIDLCDKSRLRAL